MKIAKIIFLIYLTALFSVTILPRFAISYATPDFFLTLAVVLLFRNKIWEGLSWGIIGNCFLELFGFEFPINTLVAVVIILFIYLLLSRFFDRRNVYLFLIFCFLAAFSQSLLVGLFRHQPLTLFIQFYLISALYSMSLGLIIFLVYLKYEKSLFVSIAKKEKRVTQSRI